MCRILVLKVIDQEWVTKEFPKHNVQQNTLKGFIEKWRKWTPQCLLTKTAGTRAKVNKKYFNRQCRLFISTIYMCVCVSHLLYSLV